MGGQRHEIGEIAMDADLDAAARCLLEARYVIALTGAGLSVESGIPPFRGPNGLWTKHGEPPMNGYERFLADPRKAWEDRLNPAGPMRELWESLQRAEPNPGHRALAELEEMDVLRATITQNVDNLHRIAGSRRLLEIHGNATLIRCIQCVSRFERAEIDFAVLPPRCALCGGLLKSDTVSFGEPIPADVLTACSDETDHSDCMIVAGTSATVYPAAGLPIAIAERGGDLIEVNPYASDLSPLCRITLPGTAAEVLPALVERVRALRVGI
jgi:NAD-dependent deacetylase